MGLVPTCPTPGYYYFTMPPRLFPPLLPVLPRLLSLCFPSPLPQPVFIIPFCSLPTTDNSPVLPTLPSQVPPTSYPVPHTHPPFTPSPPCLGSCLPIHLPFLPLPSYTTHYRFFVLFPTTYHLPAYTPVYHTPTTFPMCSPGHCSSPFSHHHTHLCPLPCAVVVLQTHTACPLPQLPIPGCCALPSACLLPHTPACLPA